MDKQEELKECVRAFFAMCIDVGDEFKVEQAEIGDVFRRWCYLRDVEAISKSQLYAMLARMGFKRQLIPPWATPKWAGQWYRVGLRVRPLLGTKYLQGVLDRNGTVRAQADIKEVKYRLRRRDHIKRIVEGDFVGWIDKAESAVHKPATKGDRKARLDPF